MDIEKEKARERFRETLREIDEERKQKLDARERELEKREAKIKKMPKSKASFLAPRKILTRSEYAQYKKSRQSIEREKLRAKLEELKREARFQKYSQSKSGRAGRFIARGFKAASTRGGVTMASYGSQMPMSSPQENLRRMRLQQQLNQRRAQEQRVFDWVFRCGDFETLKVENEISSGVGGASFANEGDRASIMMMPEIMSHAQVLTQRGVKVGKNKIALLKNPLLDVSLETWSAANIIS